ncbi:hypothetical protein IMAU80824_00776 [Lactiplantibacillus plantarum]|nr:hypothetical protein [Lactiplantibacillus plantarum]
MNSGRISRNVLAITTFVIVLILSLVYGLTPHKIDNYTDVMSGALSFSSIATALLFASFSLIPAFSNSRLLLALKELKTDVKLLDRLLFTTAIFLFASAFSFGGLFYSANSQSCLSLITTSAWIAFIVAGIVEMFEIIFLMFSAVQYLYSE